MGNFPKEFVKREHEITADRVCRHCGETESNACWVNCVERVPNFEDFPEDLKSYAKFRGMTYDGDNGIFVQPYGDTQTVAEMWEYVKKLKQTT